MKYPTARIKHEAVTFGSVNYADPYRWLEEDTPEALEFQERQNRLTRGWIDSRPAKAQAESLVAAMPRFANNFPTYGGGRWFRRRTPEDRNLELIEVAATIEGPWRTVVDLNALMANEPLAIDNFVPSPDGRKLLFGWSVGGRELAEVRVIDIDSGNMLLTTIPQVRPMLPAWLPDSSGFYYSGSEPASPYRMQVYRQVLGATGATGPQEYESSHPMMWAKAAADHKHIFILADLLNERPEYIRDEVSGGAWRPFLKGETAQFSGDIIGDRYFAITNDGAPCGRVVSIPLATPRDRATWRELLPGSDNVLATLIIVDQHLVVVDLVNTYSRLQVFDMDGRIKGEIPLPGRGAVCTGHLTVMKDLIRPGSDGDILFPFSSPARFPALYKANVHTLRVEVLIPPSIQMDAIIHDYTATSADGARVPYHVIARADLDLSKPRPTLFYGYGGFNVATVPGWPGSQLAAWVQAGGVLVLAHLRGGGELGPGMWHQGRLKNKQNSFNDVFAIAEDLIARDITSVQQLGLTGISNGGVMAAVTVVQRPGLFRAAVAQVPITDALGRARDPIAGLVNLEYGDPNDPDMSEVQLAWSPYQNIKDGVVYPALLLDAGKNDPRCPPWHVRKMAARLQPANVGPHPILMYVRDGAGHLAVGDAEQRALDVDYLTFLIDQLGLRNS
jgi:prolyl oligopeptidase